MHPISLTMQTLFGSRFNNERASSSQVSVRIISASVVSSSTVT